MGMNFENDTPHSLYNEFVQVENELEAIGRRIKKLGEDAINADADYEAAKNTTLIQLFAEEAGDPETGTKPFKRTEAQREAIYRQLHDRLRLLRNLKKNDLEAEKVLLKALSDKLSAMQSRKGMLLQEYHKTTDGRYQTVDESTGAWKLEGQAPAPAIDFGVGKRDPAKLKAELDAEIDPPKTFAAAASQPEAFPGEPSAELSAIYGRKTEPWADDSPIAKSVTDMVTAKQLGMIRALARKKQLDADEESMDIFGATSDELNKSAASKLIEHLQAA